MQLNYSHYIQKAYNKKHTKLKIKILTRNYTTQNHSTKEDKYRKQNVAILN